MWRWNLRLGFIILFQVLSATCSKNSSLTFVIDDTGSMGGVINQVKAAAGEIMDIVLKAKASEIEDVVLVTFNDPDVVLRNKTTSKDELLAALDKIEVDGGGDCPEYSLTGIKLALEESRHGSYLFVFTDASAKDVGLLNEVKSLCENKESQVIIILTDVCHWRPRKLYEVYYEIAKASSGQVFRVKEDEVKDVVQIIKHTINDKKAVITTVVVPAGSELTSVPFTVDDKIEYAIISTAGQNVELFVTDTSPSRIGQQIEKIMWTSSGKVVKFNPPSPGPYFAWVRGESEVSIAVYARTDFTFEHGFSEFVPKSLSDASKQPIANRNHHLSISVVDPEHTVKVESAEILDMNEQVIMTLPLKKTDHGDFYITDKFVSPSLMFKIQVTGTVKKTGKIIRRISKTAIEPQIPPRPVSKLPITTIAEGSRVDVNYDGEIMLTCKVSGYPTPEIVWTTKANTVLRREVNEVKPPYEYISYLKLKNVKYPGTYYCRASNEEGKHSSTIYVQPRSPFRSDPSPTEPIKVQYGQEKKLMCAISSSYPFDITWRTPLKPTEFTLSADKRVLTIKQVSIAAQGGYTCEATLNSDPKQKHSTTTNVLISDLAPPSRPATSGNITISHGEKIHIWCRVNRGMPPPSIRWQFKMHDDNVYRDMHVIGEQMTINYSSLANAGLYRCIAKNDLGQTEGNIKVVVQKAPVVNIQEGSKISIAYGSSTSLTCKIDAFPLPTIGWRDSKGHKFNSKNMINNNEITSELNLQNVKDNGTYSCYATNILGNVASHIDLTVTSPFVILSHPDGSTFSKYGAKTDITCGVKSSFPYRITWYKSVGSKLTEIPSSGPYAISSTGTTLHIQPTDLNAIGKYTCEVALVDDVKAKLHFTTDVQISDLSPPVLQDAVPTKITVQNNETVTISCKIASGTPPPVVSWQVMRGRDKVFQDLPDSGQELTISSATLRYAGKYRCIATNMKGDTKKTTELVVKIPPEATIDEAPTVTAPYGSTAELNCRAVAFPAAEIVWRDNKGNELASKITIDDNEVISRLTVQNTKTSDTSYTCNAKNDLGKTLASVQVTVTSPIDFPTKLPETTGVKYGAQTTIICDIKSTHPIKIKWYYQKNEQSDKSEIHPSYMYVISPDEQRLHIPSVDLDLVGKYTCEATLVSNKDENKSFSTNLIINNLKAPEIIYTNNTVTVMNGHELFISCKSTGIPEPVVTWQVNPKNSDTFENKEGSGQDFIDSKISYEWAGLYKCTAANQVGTQSHTIEVIVHGKPKITNSEFVYFGVTGDRALKIPCEVNGIPEPTISWKHGNKAVTSGTKITVSKNYIVIKDPTESDSSNFTCDAINDYGIATANFEAIVSDFITWDEGLNSNIFLKPGESKDIQCLLPHSDPQSVRWYVNGENTHVVGTFYSLRDAKFENDGNYTCRSNTDQGSESLNYVVDVGYKPSFKNMALPSTFIWNGDMQEILDCDVDAKPRVEVEWVYNGKPLNFHEVGIPVSGWGTYSCNVSNYHGSVQHNFNVTSDGCVINRTADRIQNTPLLVSDKPSTWPQFVPENEFLTVTRNQKIILECSTQDQPQNTFKTHPTAKKINAECLNEDKFIVDDITYKFEDLQCKDQVKSSSVVTEKTCMNNGKIIQIGFKLNSGFLGVYDVCYSDANHKTLFTKVVMSNVNIGNKVESSFKLNEGIKTGKNNNIMKCRYNQRWFVNPVDVAFGPAQTATLSKIYNSVPVYEPCDNSRMSWSDVEYIVQSSLLTMNTLTAWTGASNYNSQGVPMYLWKVVKYDDDTFDSIVYVNVANADIDFVCPPKSSSNLLEYSDHYTYSCNMDDFFKAFKIPKSDLA